MQKKIQQKQLEAGIGGTGVAGSPPTLSIGGGADLKMCGSPAGQILLGSGSFGLPPLAFKSDINSGILHRLFVGSPQVAQDTIDIVINTVSRLQIPQFAALQTTGQAPSTYAIAVASGGGNAIPNRQYLEEEFVDSSTDQTVDGHKTFNDEIFADSNSNAATPAYAFSSGPNMGMYRSGTNALSFSTNSIRRLTIESNGTLNVSGTANYETLVTADDDVPNKKYVDMAVGSPKISGSNPTATTFGSTFRSFGTRSISGLTPGKKYLVNISGFSACRGNGNASNRGIAIRDGIDITDAFAPVLYVEGLTTINWPDGSAPQSGSVIVTAFAGSPIGSGSGSIVMSVDFFNSAGTLPPGCNINGNGSIRQASAVQLD